MCAPRRDARRRLSDPEKLPEEFAPSPTGGKPGRRPEGLRSLFEESLAISECRRARGRKRSVASVIAPRLPATAAGKFAYVEAANHTGSFSQEELEAIGTWKNPKTGLCESHSKATMHRVVTRVDPAVPEGMSRRHSAPRLQSERPMPANTGNEQERGGTQIIRETLAPPSGGDGPAEGPAGGAAPGHHCLLAGTEAEADGVPQADPESPLRSSARKVRHQGAGPPSDCHGLDRSAGGRATEEAPE